MQRSLVIGSRGSKLAMWQAEHVKSQLQAIDSPLTVRIEIIKTNITSWNNNYSSETIKLDIDLIKLIATIVSDKQRINNGVQ